jgi:translation initiation factor IF-2
MCDLVLNQYNLPIAAFTKSYLKDLKPAIKARKDRLKAKKDVEWAASLILRAEKRRQAKALKERRAAKKLAAKQAKEAKAEAAKQRCLAKVERLSDNLKKKSLKLLLWAQKNGYTLKDVVGELEAQIADKPVALFYVQQNSNP